MAYLFASYLILWALIFGYVLSIAARQRRVEQQLRELNLAQNPSDSAGQSAGD